MELDELHILQRNTPSKYNGHPVAGVRMGIRGNFKGPAVSASGKEHGLGMEDVNFSGFNFDGNHTFTDIVLDDDIGNVKFVEEPNVPLHTLFEQGVQNHMAGAVGSVTGPADGFFAVIPGVPAKGTLRNFTVFCAAEGETEVFHFDDRVHCVSAKDFDGILISEIIAPLHGIVHVPFPVILFVVAERGTDAALGSAGMGTNRIEFAQDCYIC